MLVWEIFGCREAEKAMYHYKYAGAEADPDVLDKARKLQGHLNKCTEAKMQRDWNALLREAGLAISAGADSAPQVSFSIFDFNQHIAYIAIIFSW